MSTKRSRPGTAPAQTRADDRAVRDLGVGIDTGRYGHHVTFLREDKQPAAPAMQVMESREGYDKLQARLEQLHRRHPDARIHLRIDAAGQYATNLEVFLRSLAPLPLSISVGEPKRNKDYHHAHSPKRQTDDSESYAMARYAVVEKPEPSFGKPLEFIALRRVASRLQAQTKQTTRLTNQLHEVLSGSFSELATLVTDITCGWVLTLIEKYPTAPKVAAARLASLLAIPYIDRDKAKQIHEAAKRSTSTFHGPVAEDLIRALAAELRHSLRQEETWKTLLQSTFDALPDGPHRQIITIQGIGPQTTAAIVATAVASERFPDVNHFVGYYGVFPHESQSGIDKFGKPIPAGKKFMCSKGNDLVRGLLWQCAKCASAENGGNPAVRALYLRRLASKDSPQVAWGYCMTKLLHQVWGVWTTGKPFDPLHEERRKQAQQQTSEQQTSEPQTSESQTSESQTSESQTSESRQSAKSETEASGIRDESEPQKGIDQEVTAASAPSLEPVAPALEPVAPALEPVSHSVAPRTRPQAATATEPASGRPAIDYAALRERISFAQILEHFGRHPHGVQHRCPCPLHKSNGEHSRSFSVNLQRNLFRCFDSACQAQGNVLDFWTAYRQIPLYDAAVDLAATFQIPLPVARESPSKPPRKTQKKGAGITPPST